MLHLSEAQRAAFFRDGYLKIPGAIPTSAVERALGAINTDLGRGLDPARVEEFYARSFCPTLRNAPEILELFEATPARALAEALVAPGGLRSPQMAQIALRFPSAPPAGADLPALARPHVDGSYGRLNGVQAGQVAHFTLLCMVALSDVDSEWAGNFTVWPGSHHAYEQYFQTHGVQAMMTGTPRLEQLPTPQQLRVKAGDLVLAHYQLGHTAAPNLSAHVRYAVFFRLYHRAHDADALDILADIWREYPELQRFARERSEPR